MTTNYIYQFIGGSLGGQTLTREQVDTIACGLSPNWTLERAAGRLVPRAELDEQPKVEGYCGPMWDGTRYMGVDGNLHSDFDRSRFPADPESPVYGVIRYESASVYAMLSN